MYSLNLKMISKFEWMIDTIGERPVYMIYICTDEFLTNGIILFWSLVAINFLLDAITIEIIYCSMDLIEVSINYDNFFFASQYILLTAYLHTYKVIWDDLAKLKTGLQEVIFDWKLLHREIDCVRLSDTKLSMQSLFVSF